MRNAELNVFRELIRTRSGLPPAPDRPYRAARPPVAGGVEPACAPQDLAQRTRAAASQAPCEVAQEKPPASPECPGAPDRTPDRASDWAPDGVIHRLVELLMEMRGLSVPAPAAEAPAANARAA